MTDDDLQREPERTSDGRHIIVGGRRWRAADPGIPENLRQELVSELMEARRSVRSSAANARRRVQDAKVALGERGAPWWEQPDANSVHERSAATIRALLRKRNGSTICPSDVARVIGGQSWRKRMYAVREAAAKLAQKGELVVTQKGKPVDIRSASGPVRIAFLKED